MRVGGGEEGVGEVDMGGRSGEAGEDWGRGKRSTMGQVTGGGAGIAEDWNGCGRWTAAKGRFASSG